MAETYDLSVVIPTCNRAGMLARNLEHLEADLRCRFEIIIVDGASEDGTPAVLEQAKYRLGEKLTVIREPKRQGFVKATNLGFRAARGRNMIWLNDDARPLPGALDSAVMQIDSAAANVGFLAMFHRWHSTRNVAYEMVHGGQTYRLCHVRGTLYANFPIGRRSTYEKLDFFDERFFVKAADPDLSLKAWHAGLRIEPAYGVMIEHDETEDERRLADADFGHEDNMKLFSKWRLPEKNPHRNNFDPRNPCTLMGLSEAAIAA